MWYEMPEHVPNNQQVVWVRRTWFSDPFQATWRTTTQDFLCDNGLLLPWQFVRRWRSL